MIVIKVFLFSLFTCFLFVILGIITGLSIFGPAVAYGLGGVFSQIYVTLEGRHNTLIQFITKIITFFYGHSKLSKKECICEQISVRIANIACPTNFAVTNISVVTDQPITVHV